MKKSPLIWLGAAAFAPLVAHAEAVKIPGFTAFVEPKADGIDIRENDGVYKWSDKAQSVVWYGDLRDKGELEIALQVLAPDSESLQWRLSIEGQNPDAAKNQKFALDATATGTGNVQTVDFGKIEISEPGFYRLALSGVDKAGATFGDVKNLVLDGAAAATIVSKEGFNFTHWRGQTSTHLTYDLPKDQTYTAFYNEVTAVTDPTSTYYCAIGFNAGYIGMQVTSPTQRRAIFSIWDNAKEGMSRAKVEEKDRAGLLASGERVFTDSFGGEGTGGHSHLKTMWKTGVPQRFLVTVKADGDAAIFAGYFYRHDLKKWMLLSAWRRPRTPAKLSGFYTFNEDFNHSKQATRRSNTGNAWVRTSDGKWQEMTTARFTRTAQGEPVRRDWEAGTQGDQLWMQIGGYIDRVTDYGDKFTREPSNRPPTDLDLPPLPTKMPPRAAEAVLAPAIHLLAVGKNSEATKEAQVLAAMPDASEATKAMAKDITRLAAPEPMTYPAPSTLFAGMKSAFLSDLEWKSAEVGYGKAFRNRAMVEDKSDFPFLRTSEGKIYQKGIFAHAPSRLVFDLGGKWKTFSALGALQRGGNSVVFVVKGDGRELFRSPLIQGEDSAQVKLNISGVKTLELISEDGGDGIGSDWSLWLDPQIAR